MKKVELRKRENSNIILRNGETISKETASNFLGQYLFFQLNGKIGFGYCSGVSIYLDRNDSTIKIDIPHLHTYLEKCISNFEWFSTIDLNTLFDEENQ